MKIPSSTEEVAKTTRTKILKILKMEDSKEKQNFLDLLMKHNYEMLVRSVFHKELTRSDDEMIDRVQTIIDTLTPREITVLKWRYGLDVEHPYPCTLEEVAEVYGVTRERVRQIDAKSLRRLSHPSRSNTIKQYVMTDEELIVAKQKEEQREQEIAKLEKDGLNADVSIERLHLSVRAYNRLREAGVKTVADLSKLSEEELDQFGEKVNAELNRVKSDIEDLANGNNEAEKNNSDNTEAE